MHAKAWLWLGVCFTHRLDASGSGLPKKGGFAKFREDDIMGAAESTFRAAKGMPGYTSLAARLISHGWSARV